MSLAGCKAPQAFGDRNSLIVRADTALWAEIDSAYTASLERPIHTTRPERTFRVTFVSETDTVWRDLRQWQQVIVIGTSADPVIHELLDRADSVPSPLPGIVQIEDVWARGQIITVVALPPDRRVRGALRALPELESKLREQFESWVHRRMYVSGVDDSLISVTATFGFSLEIPQVYAFHRQDSIFHFRNVYPDPTTRLRSVVVTWERGPPVEPDPGALRDWRERLGANYYVPPQDILAEGLRTDTLTVGGRTAVELRGVYEDRTDFPAAGPFIARAVPCPDQGRIYYMDAWLYAPGDDKYEYMIQLEILLNSFTCSREEPVKLSGRT